LLKTPTIGLNSNEEAFMFKRITALIIVSTLIFSTASCSKTEKVYKTDAPLYKKTQIGKTVSLDTPMTVKMNSKGQLVVYNKSEPAPGYAILDTSGNLINEIKCAPEDTGNVFFLDSNDNLYVLAEKLIYDASGMNPQSIEHTVNIFEPSGKKIKAVRLGSKPLDSPGSAQSIGIAVDNNGNIYILNRGIGIEMFDNNGMLVKTLSTGFYEGMEMNDEGNLAIYSVNKQKNEYSIGKISTADGKIIWTKKLDEIPYRIIYSRFTKHIYVYNEYGIEKYDNEGNYVTSIMNFNKTFIGSRQEVKDICLDENESIYVTVEGSSVIDKYMRKTEQVMQTSEKKVLTISTRYDEPVPIYRKAFELFKSGHPEFELEIKSIVLSNTDNNLSRAIKDIETTLVTEMMAGKGADLIEFRKLRVPYQKFADKNLLMNFKEAIENDSDFDIDKYYKNYIYRNSYNGSLYIMPISFWFNTMIANNSLLDREKIIIDDKKWAWSDLLDISRDFSKALDSEGNKYRYAFPTDAYPDIWQNEYMHFIDREKKECNFESKEFINILNLSKEILDNNIISPDINWYADMKSPGNKDHILFILAGIAHEQNINDIRQAFHYDDIKVLRYPSVDGKDTKIDVSPFIYFGINNNSKNKEDAWEFLKILLDVEIQEEFELTCGGVPVNKEARKNIRERILEEYEKEIEANVPQEYLESPEDVELLDNLIKMHDIPDTINTHDKNFSELLIQRIIGEEASSFFKGEKSVEEVASIIQYKVMTYLNE
jgi:ABC-type glycerol-3-phosphate transport system substrate-binding protein